MSTRPASRAFRPSGRLDAKYRTRPTGVSRPPQSHTLSTRSRRSRTGRRRITGERRGGVIRAISAKLILRPRRDFPRDFETRLKGSAFITPIERRLEGGGSPSSGLDSRAVNPVDTRLVNVAEVARAGEERVFSLDFSRGELVTRESSFALLHFALITFTPARSLSLSCFFFFLYSPFAARHSSLTRARSRLQAVAVEKERTS